MFAKLFFTFEVFFFALFSPLLLHCRRHLLRLASLSRSLFTLVLLFRKLAQSIAAALLNQLPFHLRLEEPTAFGVTHLLSEREPPSNALTAVEASADTQSIVRRPGLRNVRSWLVTRRLSSNPISSDLGGCNRSVGFINPLCIARIEGLHEFGRKLITLSLGHIAIGRTIAIRVTTTCSTIRFDHNVRHGVRPPDRPLKR